MIHIVYYSESGWVSLAFRGRHGCGLPEQHLLQAIESAAHIRLQPLRPAALDAIHALGQSSEPAERNMGKSSCDGVITCGVATSSPIGANPKEIRTGAPTCRVQPHASGRVERRYSSRYLPRALAHALSTSLVGLVILDCMGSIRPIHLYGKRYRRIFLPLNMRA